MKNDKKPWVTWKEWQTRRASEGQIQQWHADSRTKGFALVCGGISGGTEVLDFDDPDLFLPFMAALPVWAKSMMLPVQQTGGGGYQLVYRRPMPGRNQKLAWIRAIAEAGAESDLKLGIETRGEGGYAVIPFSLHPEGGTYRAHAGNWADIPILTDAQAEELLDLARSFDQSPPKAISKKPMSLSASASQFEKAEAGARYVQQAVANELAVLRATKVGGRNDQLNRAAFNMGQFVQAGVLDEGNAVTSLTEAACDAGMSEEKDGISGTIRSGLAAGKAEPRDLSHIVICARDSRGDSPLLDVPWGEPLSLPPVLPSAPVMPPEMLPQPLRAWLVDSAEIACVPLEGLAASTVIGLSGLIGRSVQLDPEGLGDWRVVPNLWGGLVMRPSGLKSMQLERALEPLRELENQARQDFESEEVDRQLRLEVLKVQEEQLKKDARKNGGSLDVEGLRALRQEAREAGPTPRRYMMQDTTHEKAGELLRDNQRGLILVKDELSGWIDMMSREENAEARAFWLSSWNGNGSHDFDRIGRGTVRVDSLCVAVAGVIQPGPLQRFVQRSRAGGAGDVGFLQRFQLLIYPDGLPVWVRPTRKVNLDARACAFAVYEALDTVRRSPEPVVLTFTDEALEIFREWRDSLEHRLRGGDLICFPAFESHLGKYRSLVPSLALIFHLVDVAAQGDKLENLPLVSTEALELALNWAEFLELHARKVYSLELGTSNLPAHELLQKIKDGVVKDGVKLRDLRRKEWAVLKDESLEMAIESLSNLGWVQVQEVETGGRPSEVLRLHPKLMGGKP